MDPNKITVDEQHLTLTAEIDPAIIIKTNINNRVGGFNNFLIMENVTENKDFIARLNKDKLAENNIYYEITVEDHTKINHFSLNETNIAQENNTWFNMEIITEKDVNQSYLTHWENENKIVVVLKNKEFLDNENRIFGNCFEQNKIILEQYEEKVLLAQHELNLEKNNSPQKKEFDEENKTKILTEQIITNSELEIEKSIAKFAETKQVPQEEVKKELLQKLKNNAKRKTENHHNLFLPSNTNPHTGSSIRQNIFDALHSIVDPKGNLSTVQLISEFYLNFLKKFIPKNSISTPSYPFFEDNTVANQDEIKDEEEISQQTKVKTLAPETSFEQTTFIDNQQEVKKEIINETNFNHLIPKQAPTSTEMNWNLFEASESIPQTIAAPSTINFSETRISTNNFVITAEQINEQEINTELIQTETKPKQHYWQSLTC